MIIYLHGFSSGAASQKATVLKRVLAPTNVVVPEYAAHRPRESIAMLREYITRLGASNATQKILLIGSSLGGYYAQYLANTLGCVAGVILINPALRPQLTLQPYIGQQINQVTGESFEFSQQDFEELALFNVPINEIHRPTLVLLDEGDDVIDYQYAAKKYQSAGCVIVYPGGSHWFDHLEDAIPDIRKFYEDLN